MATLRNVLVAVDFSFATAEAVSWGIELARKENGDVILVHAFETPIMPYPGDPLPPLAGLGVAIERSAHDTMNKLVEEWRAHYPRVRGIVSEGPAWFVINEQAKTSDANVVVMGTHGRRGLPRFLIGSVTERVVRTSPIPVFTFRPHDKPDVVPVAG